MMELTEDHNALAAEYALGTLDADERAQIELTMAANRRFAELIEAWQLRLAVLHQMVDPVEPPAQLWPRIRAAVGLAAEPAPVHAAVTPIAVAPAAVAPAAVTPAAVTPSVAEQAAVTSAAAASAAASFAASLASAATMAVPHASDHASTIVIAPPDGDHHAADRTATIAPIVTSPATTLKPTSDAATQLRPVHHEAESAAAELDAPPPLPEPAPATNGSGLSPESMRVVRFAWQARRWKWTATGVSAIAASLLVVIVAQLYRPDMLPEALRPAVRTQIVRVVTPPPPMPAQYVALLQKDAASPAFILTVDASSKKFTVRKVGASDERGRSYELWLVSDKLQRPRSLGVIGERDFTTRGALASFDDDTMHEATYAVTVEPEGGSPTGIATGPVVFTGKLMETVPQGSFGK